MTPFFALYNFGHDRDPTPFTYWLFIIVFVVLGIIAVINRKELFKGDKGEDGKAEDKKKLGEVNDANKEETDTSIPHKLCVGCGESIPEKATICPKCGWTQPA